MSSASRVTSPSWWELTSTVPPRAAQSRSRCRSSTMPSGSRPFWGSSRINSSGSPSSAIPSARRIFMPVEKVRDRLRPAPAKPTWSKT